MLNKSEPNKRKERIMVFVLLLVVGSASIQIGSARDITEKGNINQVIIDNWTVNSDFEDFANDAVDWEVVTSKQYSNVEWTTDQAYSGVYSMNVTTNNTGIVTIRESFPITKWDMSPNSTYVISFKYKGNLSNTSAIRAYYNNGTTGITNDVAPLGVYNTWQSFRWVVPITLTNAPPTRTAKVYFGIQSLNNNNASVYIDDLNVTVNRQELNFTDVDGNRTIYKINITENFDEGSLHPAYVALYHAGINHYGAYYTPTFDTYVTINPNDHTFSAVNNDTFWWGNSTDASTFNNYTENMVINLTRAIINNNSASINSNQVYGYGTSMGGRILAMGIKTGIFKGVQLNSPLLNHSSEPWFTAHEGQMDWVFGGGTPNANYNNANPLWLLQNGYSYIPVRVVAGENDATVSILNNTQAAKSLYYSANKYYEMTTIYNGGHTTWVCLNFSECTNTGYIKNYFDLLRANNNDLSSVPYIEVTNASADVLRSNVTNSTTNFTFDLRTTSAANLIVTPKNYVYNHKVFISSANINTTNQISPTNATIYIPISTSQINISQISLSATPSTDYINVTVNTWGNSHKVFTASSTVHNNPTTFIIGDLPANTRLSIKVDGVQSVTPTTNGTGYITFTYTGGYSPHDFDISILALEALDTNWCNPYESSLYGGLQFGTILTFVVGAALLFYGFREANFTLMIAGVAVIVGAIIALSIGAAIISRMLICQ